MQTSCISIVYNAIDDGPGKLQRYWRNYYYSPQCHNVFTLLGNYASQNIIFVQKAQAATKRAPSCLQGAGRGTGWILSLTEHCSVRSTIQACFFVYNVSCFIHQDLVCTKLMLGNRVVHPDNNITSDWWMINDLCENRPVAHDGTYEWDAQTKFNSPRAVWHCVHGHANLNATTQDDPFLAWYA